MDTTWSCYKENNACKATKVAFVFLIIIIIDYLTICIFEMLDISEYKQIPNSINF
jgi:hypothetical protein